MTLQTQTVKIDADAFQAEAEDLFTLQTKITHDLVLREIIDSLQPINFRDVPGLTRMKNHAKNPNRFNRP
jgi:hypothetical protein